MSYLVRYTKAARNDLLRLYAFQVERDLKAARRARDAIVKSIEFLRDFHFSCRKASKQTPFLRELVIPFGADDYVVLFEIDDNSTVTILAIRHQREEDYH